MQPENGQGEASSLREYTQIIRRRKWTVLAAAALVPLAAVLLSLRQEKVYEASAQVLLSRQNLTSLSGAADPAAYELPHRFAQTQAELADLPIVAIRVLEATGLAHESPEDLLVRSDVTARENSDLLEFRVRDSARGLAVRLATEYAAQFTKYRRELDTAALISARLEVAARVSELEAAGDRSSPLYMSLVEKEQQLRTMEALQTSNAFVVAPARQAEQVQPRPVRDGVLAFALGLLLGVGLALLRDVLDTRLRSADEIGTALHLPLLARLPAPPRRLRNHDRLVMLDQPEGAHAEAFRMLRTNLEFVNLDHGARTIMVTSAVQAEGKSTTVANLAVALARAGHRVVLVDLDLRRPFLGRFFDLDGRPGLTHVALGHATLAEALVPVAISTGSANGAVENGNGHRRVEGLLEVLGSGPVPPDAGEFVAGRALGDILAQLAARGGFVLVDAPPLLRVGDAMTLSAKVDAVAVVSRLDVVRRPMVAELRRLLDASPAVKLGFVLTGAELEESYYGGYAYSGDSRTQKERVA